MKPVLYVTRDLFYQGAILRISMASAYVSCIRPVVRW